MAAITPQFPLPLPPWAKWGLRALPLVWATGQALLDHPGQVQSNGDLVWRRAAIHWRRGEGLPTEEDDAICTWDIANITNSEIDGSFDSGDYNTLDTAFETFLSQITPLQATSYAAKEIRYYRMQFNSPMTDVRRFVPSGPPEHIRVTNFPGLATGDALPPQVAFSVTEKTAIPRHWGRFYLPGFTEGQAAGQGGRWSQSAVNAVVAATQSLYQTISNAELFPVVVSTQTDKVLQGALMGITHVQADDIPDIIRRRRLEVPGFRAQLPT